MPGSAPAGAAVPRPGVTRAICEALLVELAAHGYAGASIEAVARRAGVGKAAVYRRWPSKLALVGDVIGEVLVIPQVIGTGVSLRDDIYVLLESFARLLAKPGIASITADLASQALRIPELNSRITVAVGEPTRRNGRKILDEAIARGELRAEIDREIALDIMVSPVYWRTVVRRYSIAAVDLDRFATAIAAALVAL